MKRINKIFFALLIGFVGIIFANAQEEYKLDWKSDQLSIETIRHMLPISDGILVGGYDDDFHVMMIKLDKNGKEVKTLTLDYEGVVNGIYEYNGKYYFIATNDDEMWNVYVYEIDKDLNIERSKATNFYEEGSVEISNIVGDKVYVTTIGIGGFSGFGVSDDDDYYDSYYIDLDDFSTGKGTNNDFSKFSKSQQTLIWAFKNYNMNMPTAAYVGHGITMIGGNIDPSGNNKGFVDILKTDSLDSVNTAWYGELPDGFDNWEDFASKRELTKYSWYNRIVDIDDYIVAGGENYAFLDIYDHSGKYVDKIDIVNYLYGASNLEMSSQLLDMTTTVDSLYVAYQYCDIEDNCSVNCKVGVAKIKVKYNIETKVSGGEGIIKVVNNASYGDEITFEVVPENGYVLDVIKVTDASGKVVTFKNNKFTMPSADVTIEAVFVKSVDKIIEDTVKNPETRVGTAVMGLLILSILALVITSKYGKKLRWLK